MKYLDFVKVWWQKHKEVILKRLKSYLWRLAVLAGTEVVNYVVLFLADVEAPQVVVAVVGLALGEVTKHLNNLKQAKGITL